jgi:uncharacterized membrane protein YccC
MVLQIATNEQVSPLHIARTTLAAVASLAVARVLRMPEPYWATITTIVVMQSTLGAAWRASRQRFAGTALGAVAGGLVATYFGSNLLAYAVAIAATGFLCLALHLDRTAFRFVGITIAIIMLVAHPQSAWVIAVRRFVEVSLGIAVALIMSAVWPEREVAGPVSGEP